MHLEYLLPLLAILGMACASTPQQASPSPRPLIGFAIRDQERARDRQRQEIRTPGPEHRLLDSLSGDFRATIRYWAREGEPPSTSTATSSNAWIAGGRFVSCQLRGEIAGQPWERCSILGYDRGRTAYVETRVDSLTTEMPGIAVGHTEGDEGAIVFTRTIDDPVLGQSVHLREQLTIEGWRSHRFEQWIDPPGGQPYQMLEIRYERIR